MRSHEVPPQAAIWAAGGVLYRKTESGKVRFLLIHRPRYDDWSLPKGKLGGGETFAQAAERETREETGTFGTLGPYIGTISYETNAGNQKVVRYWLLEHTGGDFKPNAEVDAIEWFSKSKALRQLTYERDKGLLARAHELISDPSLSRVYLLRHADAGKRSDWPGDDHIRPLTRVGRKQTSVIHDLLVERPMTGISSSPHLRCRQTVAGLGKTLGFKVQSEPVLEESAAPEALVKRFGKLSGETIVMCSHGDVVAGTIGLLAAEGTKLDGPREWEKGSIWVLDVAGRRVRSARYIPPPA